MGNRADAQSVAPGPEQVPKGTASQVWSLSCPASFLPAAALPSSLLGTARGRLMGTRLSWLLFASANLKNALVFPFGLGSPQQLPFMSIEPGTEAVGARGQGSLACSLVGFVPLAAVSVTSCLHFSFSPEFPETGNKCPEF